MPVVSCPKCSAGLRVPDGSTAAVRCPKCTTVFQPPKPKAAAPADAGFEVVDDAPPKPAPRAAAPRPAASPPPPPAPKKAFSLDDAVRSADKSPRRDARDDRDDDDDDRDRDRRRRDDRDDDDDRPRGRSRRDRDDDDDYDDRRDRGRRRRDDDDDYDERDRDRPRKGSKFGVARPGVLLILISLGLYFGGMALHALFLFIAWVGGVIPHALVVITGVLGLAGWVVALVGLGLTIAGPAKARGLAIAATAVAVVHLILLFVVANNRESAVFGGSAIPMLSANNRAERVQDIQKELSKEMQSNPGGPRAKELRESLTDYSRDLADIRDAGGGMRWHDLVTALPRLDALVGVLVYHSRGFEYYLWSLFAGLLELARLVLLGLLLGSLARAAKDHRAEGAAKFGWVAAAGVTVAGLLIIVLAMVLAESAAKDARASLTGAAGGSPPAPQFGQNFNDFRAQMEAYQEQQRAEFERAQQRARSVGRSIRMWSAGSELLVYTLHAGALVLPALAALGVFRAMGRRK